jgi:hypothetical protein
VNPIKTSGAAAANARDAKYEFKVTVSVKKPYV